MLMPSEPQSALVTGILDDATAQVYIDKLNDD